MSAESPEGGVRLEIVSVTPEEQEANARLLPACDFPDVDTLAWTEHRFQPRFRLLLPRDFARARDVPDELRFWTASDGSLFLMTRHAGDGRASTHIISDDHGTPEDHGACRLGVAGRTVAMFTWTLVRSGRRLYCGSMDAGIRSGIGVGVAIEAPTPHRRAELVAAMQTITIVE
jgi:hypothetical protein